MKFIYRLYNQIFHRVTVEQLKHQELYIAQCSLLQAQTQLDYYKAMVDFNRQRIQRLQPHETTDYHSVAAVGNPK